MRAIFRLACYTSKYSMLYSFILLFFLWTSYAHALVLEELIQNNTLETTLQNKKIGYFVGSFDPAHKAHEAIAETPLTLGLCDYVIIHPVWGGDIYKVRSNVDIRLKMLFSLFADHPKIIVSAFTPQALQNALTTPTSDTKTAPAFTGTTFIGILGSDTALYLAPNPETSDVYMTGLKIPEEYYCHTWGSCMALPVDSFIVALRGEDDISPLANKLRERPIIATFEINDKRTISSTALKKALQNKEPLHTVASDPIIELIDQHSLYK